MGSRTQSSRPRSQKNFEAKDRSSRGQGHRRKCSQKKKVFKNFFQATSKKRGVQKFFSGEKGLQKIFFQAKKVFKNFFFRRSVIQETKKKVFADFPQGFWRFPTKFQRFKNTVVLSARAIFEDLRLRGQGLQNVSLRTSSRILPRSVAYSIRQQVIA